jgi:hypothetical protein
MFGIFVFVESGLLLAVLALSFIGVIFAISTIINMPPYISAPILITILLLNKNKNAKWIQSFIYWLHKSKIVYFIKKLIDVFMILFVLFFICYIYFGEIFCAHVFG